MRLSSGRLAIYPAIDSISIRIGKRQRHGDAPDSRGRTGNRGKTCSFTRRPPQCMGDTPTLPKREDQTPNPISPYAVSKLIGERYCEVYHALHVLETVSLRYFNVFGPRQDSDSPYAAVIPLFIQPLLNGQRPRVFGDGEQTRDFTFVSNAVDANLCAASAEGAPGRVFNVACQQRTSLNELLRIIGDIGGVFPQAEYADSRAGDVRDSLADIGQAREVLGYAPATTLVQGLEETYDMVSGGAGKNAGAAQSARRCGRAFALTIIPSIVN